MTDLSWRVRLLSLAKIAGHHGHFFQVRTPARTIMIVSHGTLTRGSTMRRCFTIPAHLCDPDQQVRSAPLVYLPSSLPLVVLPDSDSSPTAFLRAGNGGVVSADAGSTGEAGFKPDSARDCTALTTVRGTHQMPFS